ncbi:MAG: hypothetical protein LBB21_00595 [Holosporaceae bacterium]|jgi:hypothetical protein|nr:hypothetical protein [Holosporaceae bacterium]
MSKRILWMILCCTVWSCESVFAINDNRLIRLNDEAFGKFSPEISVRNVFVQSHVFKTEDETSFWKEMSRKTWLIPRVCTQLVGVDLMRGLLPSKFASETYNRMLRAQFPDGVFSKCTNSAVFFS